MTMAVLAASTSNYQVETLVADGLFAFFWVTTLMSSYSGS